MKKILLALILCSSVYAQEAFVLKTAGKAYLNSDGTWQAVKKDMLVTSGDSITTEAGGSVTLKLLDGHTVKIMGDSIFSLRENSENLKEMDIWLGRLFAKVEKLSPSKKFTVRTPVAVCAVRGTEFTVDVDENKKTDVYVSKGIVGVMDSAGSGEEVFVEKGMMSSVKQGKAASKPVKRKVPPRKTEKKVKKEKKRTRQAAKPAAEIESFRAETPSSEPAPKAAKRSASAPGNLAMNGSIGAVTLTRDGVTKVYYEFSMYPEITLGKLGIGLELVVHFDENNQILKDEWKKEKYPEKIDYIRWGRKHQDPFYFLIGRFRRPVSIGHGFIVNNYSNMARYPNVKKIGLEFDLDMNKWGIEAMTDDVTRADVIGGRLYARPLLETGVPLIRNLKIAASAGTDKDPDSNSDTKDDAVTVIGADVELPLLSFKYFKASAYGDIAKMQMGEAYDSFNTTSTTNLVDGGIGKSAGLSGKIFFLNFRGEYRVIEDNFIPGYFDGHYDLSRWQRFSTTNSSTTKAVQQLWGKTKDPVKVGPYIEAWFSFFRIIDFRASYENYNTAGSDDPFYPHLIASASMAKLPMLDNYTLEADYDKKGARTWNDIKNLNQNAILSVKVGYSVAPNVTMYIVTRRNYDSEGNPTKTMTAETRIRF